MFEAMTSGYRQLAQLYKILSHPVRLRILEILSECEACVCHLTAALNQRLAELHDSYKAAGYLKKHAGNSFGASIPQLITPEFVRSEVAPWSTTGCAMRVWPT